MSVTWRDRIRPMVAEAIASVRSPDIRVKRKLAMAACPYREHHPHRIWLSEVRLQLGIKPPHKPDPKQPELF